NVVLAKPPPGTPVRGLVVMQNFCGIHMAMHKRYAAVRSLTEPPGMCDSWLKPLVQIILGKYIDGPPMAQVLSRGYAVAIVYAADLVPDDERASGPVLARLYGPGGRRSVERLHRREQGQEERSGNEEVM
ncbi:MAG: hypothetical protein U1B84_35140, partial [Variovorax sp.]|nr:hypothetical protein [Variovorax sp.]